MLIRFKEWSIVVKHIFSVLYSFQMIFRIATTAFTSVAPISRTTLLHIERMCNKFILLFCVKFYLSNYKNY